MLNEEKVYKSYVENTIDHYFSNLLIDLSNKKTNKMNEKIKDKNFLEFSFFEHTIFLIPNLVKGFTFENNCSVIVDLMLKNLKIESGFYKHFSKFYLNKYQFKSEIFGLYAFIFSLLIKESENYQNENILKSENFKKVESELTKLIDYLKVNSDLQNFEHKFAEEIIILPKLVKILKKFLSKDLINKFKDIAENSDLPLLGIYLLELDKSLNIKYERIKSRMNKKNLYEEKKDIFEEQKIKIKPLSDKKNFMKKKVGDNSKNMKSLKKSGTDNNNTFSMFSICGSERKNIFFETFIKKKNNLNNLEKKKKVKKKNDNNQKLKMKEKKNKRTKIYKDFKFKKKNTNRNKERIIKKTMPNKYVTKKREIPKDMNILTLDKLNENNYKNFLLTGPQIPSLIEEIEKKHENSYLTKIVSFDELYQKHENREDNLQVNDWRENIIAMRTPNKN